jgi:hypothetical protein
MEVIGPLIAGLLVPFLLDLFFPNWLGSDKPRSSVSRFNNPAASRALYRAWIVLSLSMATAFALSALVGWPRDWNPGSLWIGAAASALVSGWCQLNLRQLREVGGYRDSKGTWRAGHHDPK